ncbi:MAG: hypothetical protein IJZ30_01375 [Alphaproteobacteria bacterium]|nr:hypothetical protein [Alphaproteobacteria bacterium]
MNKYLEKIKNKAMAYTFVGLSLFGGTAKSQAQNNDDNSSIDVVHSAYTSNSDIMRSYHESISMQLNDETYLMSNNIIIIDIGQGYHIMSEAYNVNNKQDMSLSLLSPDERVIGLDFYNTKDFMLPSELVAKNDPFVKNGKEPLNSSDPQVIKKHNDNWENKQRINAMKKIKNPQDREAFYRFLKIERATLENTRFPIALGNASITGYTENYFNTLTNIPSKDKTPKNLRKMYKEIKKHMQSSPENLREKALKGDTTQTARLDYLWLKNQTKE